MDKLQAMFHRIYDVEKLAILLTALVAPCALNHLLDEFTTNYRRPLNIKAGYDFLSWMFSDTINSDYYQSIEFMSEYRIAPPFVSDRVTVKGKPTINDPFLRNY
jgi:hypothetical protein